MPPPTAPLITAPPSPSWRLLPQWQPGSPESRGLDGSGSVPEIMFPVLGPVAFGDGWALPRGNHGERPHEGTDITGVSGQPLRAAFDGVITRHQAESHGIAGVVVTVTRADGLRANYFHLNDDTPGTTDDRAPAAWRIPGAIELGTTVRAGQIIGFLGDTGNAGSPHLHFELRRPDGTPINPYPALVAAEQREGCFGAFGPWANVGWTEAAGFAGAAPGGQFAGAVSVHGRNGAHWVLSLNGEVMTASATSIVIGRNACGG
jgi:hypothetical protein